jgi:uncharacterized paraquat-inducible protein A
METLKDWITRYAIGLAGIMLIAIIGISLYDSFRAVDEFNFALLDQSTLALLITGWLFWLGYMILILYGLSKVARLMRSPVQEALVPAYAYSGKPRVAHACPTCGHAVLTSWSHCPHCGEELEGRR